MALGDIPLFQALKSKMRWHQARQGVLAENIANSDTPGFGAKDLKEYSFKEHIGRQALTLSTTSTSSAHFSGAMGNSDKDGKVEKADSFEVTPSGNNVILEEQVMKVAQNQLDFQAATTLYNKGLGLIRTALAKSA